jgi:hypothetical protein
MISRSRVVLTRGKTGATTAEEIVMITQKIRVIMTLGDFVDQFDVLIEFDDTPQEVASHIRQIIELTHETDEVSTPTLDKTWEPGV